MKLIKQILQLNESTEFPTEIKEVVAREGATIADNLQNAGRKWDSSNSRQVDLQILKSQGRKFVTKGGPKVVDALAKINDEHRENGKIYDSYRSEAEAFKKKYGFTVVYAWEALRQQKWPYYKMGGYDVENGSKVTLT